MTHVQVFFRKSLSKATFGKKLSSVSLALVTFRVSRTTTTPHHNRFTALFPGPPAWAGARRELLDFMVQGKINRGTHTDHPVGRHSIRTKQCPPPASPHFLQAGCPSCHPTNSVKALKTTHNICLYCNINIFDMCAHKRMTVF